MPAPVALKLKELTGLDYIEGYGMSETMAGALINPVSGRGSNAWAYRFLTWMHAFSTRIAAAKRARTNQARS